MPMGNILEEERRITIEGFIFDKEVRELRSKRKILILKITDYTSSFVVKKFSNGEKMNKFLMRFNHKVGFVFVVVYKKIPSCVI